MRKAHPYFIKMLQKLIKERSTATDTHRNGIAACPTDEMAREEIVIYSENVNEGQTRKAGPPTGNGGYCHIVDYIA